MQLIDRIGRRLKLDQLHVLMTVVQAGSMRKAAALLNTSQPVVSRTIAELEHAIGVRLLDRDTKGVEPTEYGRAMIKHGVAAFDELKQGVLTIEHLADPGAGEVRIGSTTYTAEFFVSAVIERLSRRHPRIVFHLVTSVAETLHRELSARRLDVLITRRSDHFSEAQFGFEVLYDPTIVVMAGAKTPWVRRRRIALAELVNEAWVLPPLEGVIEPAYREVFLASGLDYPRATVFAAFAGVRLNLVATGRFLTITSTHVLDLVQRPGISVLPVELRYARTPVGIITMKNRTVSPTAQLFIDEAHKVAKPNGPRRH